MTTRRGFLGALLASPALRWLPGHIQPEPPPAIVPNGLIGLYDGGDAGAFTTGEPSLVPRGGFTYAFYDSRTGMSTPLRAGGKKS